MTTQILCREDLAKLDRHLQQGVDVGALMGFDLKSEMLLLISLLRRLVGKGPLYRVEHEIYEREGER